MMGEAAEKGKEKWPLVRLGDVAKISSGGTPSRSNPEYWDNGIIPWVKIGDIDGKYINETEESITESGLNNSSAKKFPKGTLLYTIFATLGEVSILNIDAATNQAIAGIQFDDSVNTDYAYYFLLSLQNIVKNAGRGVAQNNINQTILKNIQIPLPPLPEQQRIAAVLDQVSSLIALRKAQLAKLDLLVKARFVEMFGTENEFSMWQCGTVADVANVFVGVVIKPAQYYTDKRNGIPAFRSQNIGCMKVKDNDWVYFTEEGHLKNKKTIINENDVLVVRSGTPGIACVASAKCSGYNAVDIIIVRPHQNQINPVFLAMFTNMPHGRNQIKEKTGGAAQQHLNIRSYESMKIIRPPLNLQNQFSAFVKQTNRSECEIQHGLIHLETLKKSLMQEYFG